MESPKRTSWPHLGLFAFSHQFSHHHCHVYNKGLCYCATVESFELNDSFPVGDLGSKSVFGRGGVLDDLSLGSLGSHDLGTSKSSSAAKYQAYSSSYR